MGIQPIDLQTMYSQASNVAKSLSGTQQAQLAESMQQQANIQRNLENASKVQQPSNEKSDTAKINQNGSGSQDFSGRQEKKNKKNDGGNGYVFTGEEENSFSKNSPSYLGNIIDISR